MSGELQKYSVYAAYRKYDNRIKTFGIESHLTVASSSYQNSDDEGIPPFMIYHPKSHFRFLITEQGRGSVTCNVKTNEELIGILENSKYAFQSFMDMKCGLLKQPQMISKEDSRPAFSVRFNMGHLKDRTPADVLKNDPDGRNVLLAQETYLKQNLEKYPGNAKYIEAIEDLWKHEEEMSGKQLCRQIIIPITKLYKPSVRNEKSYVACMNVSCICDPEVRSPIKLSIDNFYLDAAGNKDTKFSMSKSIELTFEEWNTSLWKVKRNMCQFEYLYAGKIFTDVQTYR
ncbi:hypothetical protein ACTQZS_07880 [Bilifractor sp. LCP19S3_H10]|uniref:hypothetical protein n=1 Tax=Bilifractor sp. LCP19S3_H10 TaxID=3438736 RepID=UPI003F8F96BB